jgi:hypothetical protein
MNSGSLKDIEHEGENAAPGPQINGILKNGSKTDVSLKSATNLEK